MVYFALVFLVVAMIAGILGVSGIAEPAESVAWVLFVVGLVLAIVFFIRGRVEMIQDYNRCTKGISDDRYERLNNKYWELRRDLDMLVAHMGLGISEVRAHRKLYSKNDEEGGQ